eukprot:7423453-Ditylum_brightwellii.AAC.1
MDMVLSSQGKMVEEVVEVIKSQLDECNIGGGYNTTCVIKLFRVQSNKLIYQINCLEGMTGQMDPVKRGGASLRHAHLTVVMANSKVYLVTGKCPEQL